MKYNVENRVNKCKGYVTLLDIDKIPVATRKFQSIKQRKDIITFWSKTYRLEEKSYYILIQPM